nr:hypothetical protein [Desulfobulbaceae bacterium]
MNTKNQRSAFHSLTVDAMKLCGTAATVTYQGSIMGAQSLFSGIKQAFVGADEKKDEFALSKLEKAVFFAGQSFPAIQEDVALRRIDIEIAFPEISKEQISAKLSQSLINRSAFKTGAFGGLTSAPGTIPGIGTLGTIAVSLTADVVHKLRVQIELCYAIATVYDIEMGEAELQATALALIGISVKETTTSRLGAQATREMVDAARGYLATGMAKGATRVVDKLTVRTGSRALRIIPFLGIPLGAYLNSADARRVGRQAQKYFSSLATEQKR